MSYKEKIIEEIFSKINYNGIPHNRDYVKSKVTYLIDFVFDKPIGTTIEQNDFIVVRTLTGIMVTYSPVYATYAKILTREEKIKIIQGNELQS